MDQVKAFISYSRADSALADPLAKLARALDVQTFVDRDSILAGRKWRAELAKGIEDATLVVLLWCEHAERSNEVRREWVEAIRLDKNVLPLLLDNTPLPPELAEFQAISFQGLGFHFPSPSGLVSAGRTEQLAMEKRMFYEVRARELIDAISSSVSSGRLGRAMSPIKTADLPRDILRKVADQAKYFAVGLVKFEASGEARLVGSGTLVKATERFGILTAAHVADEMPKMGRVGVTFAEAQGALQFDAQALQCVWSDRGSADIGGPDIALMAGSSMGAIATKRSFHNLDMYAQMIDAGAFGDGTAVQEGYWMHIGYVAEWTKTERSGNEMRRTFNSMAGIGAPLAPFTVGGYDYIDNNAGYEFTGEIESFGGMSGGGLWHVQMHDTHDLLRWFDSHDEDAKMEALWQMDEASRQALLNSTSEPAKVTYSRPYLCGVTYYQIGDPRQRRIRCHYRDSVYQVARVKLAEFGTPLG